MDKNNHYRKHDRQEYIIEDGCMVEDQGKYLRVDWFGIDPHPEESWFDTEVGPCPKQAAVLDGDIYVRTDFSMFSKS